MHGGSGADTFALTAGSNATAIIADFIVNEDSVTIYYDGDGPVPELSLAGEPGALTLVADGKELAILSGIEVFDLASVQLVAT